MKIIETERLILRTWKDEDSTNYFNINQDPQVIEFLRGTLTIEEVKEFITTCNLSYQKNDFGLFAAELKESNELIGFIGLSIPGFEAHFTPAVEIGWRIGSEYWGRGYVTEGAKAVLKFGFNQIGLEEIVSFASILNKRSIAVMQRIGMKRNINDDFLHPKLPIEHRLSQHVLYRIKNKI